MADPLRVRVSFRFEHARDGEADVSIDGQPLPGRDGYHHGDPCVYCGLKFEEIPVGPCLGPGPLRARIADLERQRDNLQRCNNEYLERIRKAEQVIPVTFDWARSPYGTGDLSRGDGF